MATSRFDPSDIVVPTGADPEEAAAIIAALQRLSVTTDDQQETDTNPVEPWRRAARLEDVGVAVTMNRARSSRSAWRIADESR